MTKLEIIADGRTIRPWKFTEAFWIRWDTIFQAYARPSENKITIWERIVNNALHVDADVGINSKNSNYFTCHGFMYDDDFHRIEFKLTKEYCYVRYCS